MHEPRGQHAVAHRHGYEEGERERLELQQRWMLHHGPQHRGKWVAITGDRFLAAGSTITEVYRAAQDMGVASPFVAFVEEEDPPPFVTW